YGQGLLGLPATGVPKAAVIAQLWIMWLLAKDRSSELSWFPFGRHEQWLWSAIIQASAYVAKSPPISGEMQFFREETPDRQYRVEIENKRGTNLRTFLGWYIIGVDPGH